MKQLLYLSIATVIFTACETTTAKTDAPPSAFNLDSAKTMINSHNEAFSSAMINGDSAAIVPMYTADASVMGPNMPAGKGGPAIGAVSSMIKKMGASQFKVWSTDVQGNADMVVEEGKWEIRGDKMKDNGKFLVVWKNDNGKWKIAKDIWNSDNPPMPAK